MIKGSIVALVTPFTADDRVDFSKLRELVEFHIAKGTDGILVLGTTGESPSLTHTEQVEIVSTTVEAVDGRIHVMAGIGSNDTKKSIALGQEFGAMGVDSLLAITPYYNKTNEAGMFKHFTAIADNVPKPVILYNVPGRTGCGISVQNVEALALHPNIAGIKEASGNLGYVMEISRYLSEDFVMYSGNDDMIIPLLSVGAVGVISVWANIMPDTVHEVVASFSTNPEKSLRLQLKHLDVINGLFVETNPIPVKYAMTQMGLLENGDLRLPLDKISRSGAAKLGSYLREGDLIK
ncbi:MAG: 4-hydroxy-tetrahydrodipicolinate synthase [Turicibacter sp.]|nr:4-hydroxy-tetrahydrodipicolinate synthase [Turicibacter sp.]